MTEDVLNHDPLTRFDLMVAGWFRSVQTPNGLRVMRVVSAMGSPTVLAILGVLLAHGEYQKLIEIGEWVRLPQYEFRVEFLFDRLSIPMAVLSFVLCGTISAFAARYLHREPGFNGWDRA